MKKFIVILAIFALLLAAVEVVDAGMIIPVSDMAKEKSKASEKSPVISETESGEWELERLDFIHYAKPDRAVKPPRPDKAPVCYDLLGYKWKNGPVEYIINPANISGLDEWYLATTVKASAETWDAVTGIELFNDSYAIDYDAVYGVQNFQNAIQFGFYPNNNVIGVTSIWYTRKGKEIVEFDMLLNEQYAWGDGDIDPSVMDLKNILVHELGHAVGMGDVYSDACSDVSMYGYADYGEVNKRSLEKPDIAGILGMYGI